MEVWRMMGVQKRLREEFLRLACMMRLQGAINKTYTRTLVNVIASLVSKCKPLENIQQRA